MSYQILYDGDYPLNSITGFEGYLFVTTDRWKAVHRKFAGKIRVVDEIRKQEEFSCDEESRNAAKKRFNAAWKAEGIGLTEKSRIGSLLIDLRDISSVYDEDEYSKLADELSDIIAYWAAKENRVCVIVPHLDQENNNRSGMRLPHLHVIYEKKPREKDALTRFLNSILTK